MSLIIFSSFIVFSRLLSLFAFSPLIAELLSDLSVDSYSPVLISILSSCYGFTQACFQYPWARLSDFVPRLTLVRILLALFAFSSLGCYFSESIYILIVFRTIQGLSALQAVLMAMLSDYYQGVRLKKSMLFIGVAVMLALILGYSAPIFIKTFNLSSQFFFLISAFLCLIAILLSYQLHLPNLSFESRHQAQLPIKLSNLSLFPFALNFLIHFIQSALIILSSLSGKVPPGATYITVLLFALVLALPALSPKCPPRNALGFCLALLLCHFCGISFFKENFLLFCLFIHFSLMFILESCLPSIVVQTHPQFPKGYLMGVNSFIQYLGMSCGFFIAPYVHFVLPSSLVLLYSFLCLILASILWLNISSLSAKFEASTAS